MIVTVILLILIVIVIVIVSVIELYTLLQACFLQGRGLHYCGGQKEGSSSRKKSLC